MQLFQLLLDLRARCSSSHLEDSPKAASICDIFGFSDIMGELELNFWKVVRDWRLIQSPMQVGRLHVEYMSTYMGLK